MAINLDHVAEQITVTDTAANASLTVNPKGTGAFNVAAGSSGVNISNGGTVTALTQTASGGLYTSIPSVAISAPTTAGGTQATASVNMQLANTPTVTSGGTGYTNGDVLTIVGGTFSAVAQLTVTAVSGGVITSATISAFGTYTVLPSSPVSVTGGTGSSATFTVTWGVRSLTITAAGSGYVEQPTVTFSGGGGSSAAAYATLGSGVAALRGLTSNFAIYTPAGEHTRFVDNGQGNTYWTVYSNPTLISPNGSAANIPASFSSKGASGINLYTNTGNQLQAVVTHTASAVNYVQATGAATGSGPTISAQGSDTNADLNLLTKGIGYLKVNNSYGTHLVVGSGSTTAPNAYAIISGDQYNRSVYGSSGGTVITAGGSNNIAIQTASTAFSQLNISHTASAVNYVNITGAATGGSPQITAQGSDTNIGLNLFTKGTGGFNFASSGNSIFSGNGGTHFRVRTDIASASTFWEVFGSTGGPIFRSTGATAQIQTSGGALALQTDNAGTTQLNVSHTASAVNYVQATGAATGASPVLLAQGSDTNIQIQLQAKGTGLVRFATGGGLQAYVSDTVSAVNYVQITGAATGGAPVISGQGSDANVRLVLTSKGGSAVDIFTGNAANIQARFAATGNGTNYVQLGGANTTFGPLVSSAGSDTNIPLVLQPKGTGALQAQQTDSTATGGNARGANSVDWQMQRNASGQVASGTNSFIGGGGFNTAGGSYSSVVTGFANTANATVACVLSGQSNVVVGNYAVIAGGVSNAASGWLNFIGGGFTNSGTANASVTTQSATMNATTAVTLSGSNASIKVGQYITGTSIAADTYVAAISGTSLTLSKVASGSSTSTLSFFTPHGVVVGGGNNTATGSYSFIGGGGDAGTSGNRNVASGDWSFVGGGAKNLASGLGSAVVGGGIFQAGSYFANTASGTSSFVGGGTNNTASGGYSVITGGLSNVASGTGTFIGSSDSSTASGAYSSILSGQRAITRGIIGNTVFGSGAPISLNVGASQAALLILNRQTTDATPTVLTSETNGPNTTNQIILPNNSAYFFTGEVVAGVTGGGDTKGWKIEGVIKRGANAASTALVGTPTVTSTYADAGASTWVIAVTADTTNGGLAVTFTGQASTTIRTVAQIRTTEMTF